MGRAVVDRLGRLARSNSWANTAWRRLARGDEDETEAEVLMDLVEELVAVNNALRHKLVDEKLHQPWVLPCHRARCPF